MLERRHPPFDVGISRRSFIKGMAAVGALAVFPTVLSGCSAGSGSKAKTMQFWNLYSPSPNNDPVNSVRAKWMHDVVAEWNANNDRQIELIQMPSIGSQKLATAFAAGAGPDIFQISPGDITRYLNGNALVDLTPYLTPEAQADFYPDAIATRKVGDRIYALPQEVEPIALFYSKPAFERAGLSEADLPKTWDEMISVAQHLMSKKQPGYVVEVSPGYYQNFVWYPWMWQGGGNVLSPDGKRSAFNSPATVNALRFMKEGVDLGVAPRVLPAGGDIVTAFTQNYASMWQSGSWSVQDFLRKAPKFEYGVIPLPLPPGGKPATSLGGWTFCANAFGPYADDAGRFCAWALGSMDSEGIDRVARWCMDAKRDMSPRKSVAKRAEELGEFKTPTMRLFRDKIYPTGHGEPRYPPVIYKAVSDAIQSCQLAGGDPAHEAAVASQAIDAYLTTYSGVRLS